MREKFRSRIIYLMMQQACKLQDNEPVEGQEVLVSKYSEDIIIPTQVSFFSYISRMVTRLVLEVKLQILQKE